MIPITIIITITITMPNPVRKRKKPAVNAINAPEFWKSSKGKYTSLKTAFSDELLLNVA